MTDIQIRECFGIESSAPDRVLRNDEEILQSIKNNIGISEIFGDCNINDLLQEIRQEINKAIDCIPITFSRNDADDCLKRDIKDIFDKHIKEIEG